MEQSASRAISQYVNPSSRYQATILSFRSTDISGGMVAKAGQSLGYNNGKRCDFGHNVAENHCQKNWHVHGIMQNSVREIVKN